MGVEITEELITYTKKGIFMVHAVFVGRGDPKHCRGKPLLGGQKEKVSVKKKSRALVRSTDGQGSMEV